MGAEANIAVDINMKMCYLVQIAFLSTINFSISIITSLCCWSNLLTYFSTLERLSGNHRSNHNTNFNLNICVKICNINWQEQTVITYKNILKYISEVQFL